MNYDLNRLTFPLSISKRFLETSDAVSLTLQVPDEHKNKFRFLPGQFVTLFLDVDGEVLPRSYSIASSPLVDKELKITIKKVINGKGSNYIFNHLKEGHSIRVSPPSGHFYHPQLENVPTHYVLFAGGSGITPLFSILKTVLMSEPEAVVSLVYANKNSLNIIYKSELIEWENKFPSRFKIHHVFSKPNEGDLGHKGRCEGFLLQQLWMEVKKTPFLTSSGPIQFEFYLCGPDGFMENIHEELKRQGCSEAQIHRESFTTTVVKTESMDPLVSSSEGQEVSDDENSVLIGDTSAGRVKGPHQLTVTLGGEILNLSVNENQTVLEALIEAEANPPYSCLEGNCMACVGRVLEGRVFQKEPGILLDENIAAGEALTCKAFPYSKFVHIDYDSV
ncbi:MAG: ferredoxin--NADP reductase [Bdellovibrionales bacterium]|nr:ferredoxin--NADP reductase [Bdellovibrionales bacterium]